MATRTRPSPAGTGRGEAGRGGDEVRSDLHVTIASGRGKGIAISLKSRVEPYYGEAIRRQATEVLEALGVSSARVEIDDSGALPFAIAARIETAVRRAGMGSGARALPEKIAALPPPSEKVRIRRSRLYLPGSEPKYFINAGLHEPDGIILDLEDSVHPDEKDAARFLARNALRSVDFGKAERMVRINPLPLGLEDLAEVVPEAPDLLLIPKVEDPEQIHQVDRALDRILGGKETGKGPWLMPILESARGIENAYGIARASGRIAAITIGLEDYTADLGVGKTPEGAESWYARARLVNAARAAGVQAIDSVYADVGDLGGLRRWAGESRKLGFAGMGCLHPRQIPVIHERFNPTEEEIGKALKIVAAYRKARELGLGVVSLGSKMIDPPVVERARQTVESAGRLGLIPAGEAPKGKMHS